MDEQSALNSQMLITELRPKLTKRCIDKIDQLRFRDARVTTVGQLLGYAKDHGDRWINWVPGLTRCEKAAIAMALENFWLGVEPVVQSKIENRNSQMAAER